MDWSKHEEYLAGLRVLMDALPEPADKDDRVLWGTVKWQVEHTGHLLRKLSELKLP